MDKQNIKAALITAAAVIVVCAIVYNGERKREAKPESKCTEQNLPDGSLRIDCDELKIPDERKE